MDFDSGLKIYINWLEEKGINFERVKFNIYTFTNF